MKSVIAILLIGVFASIQTPLGQFFKLPLLIEHYIKHQKQNGVSLITFLEDHYALDHEDADLPEDNQLPFKSTTFSLIGYVIITQIIQVNVVVLSLIEKRFPFLFVYSPQQYLAGVFHPPRI
jgi:hypothetical protein